MNSDHFEIDDGLSDDLAFLRNIFNEVSVSSGSSGLDSSRYSSSDLRSPLSPRPTLTSFSQQEPSLPRTPNRDDSILFSSPRLRMGTPTSSLSSGGVGSMMGRTSTKSFLDHTYPRLTTHHDTKSKGEEDVFKDCLSQWMTPPPSLTNTAALNLSARGRNLSPPRSSSFHRHNSCASNCPGTQLSLDSSADEAFADNSHDSKILENDISVLARYLDELTSCGTQTSPDPPGQMGSHRDQKPQSGSSSTHQQLEQLQMQYIQQIALLMALSSQCNQLSLEDLRTLCNPDFSRLLNQTSGLNPGFSNLLNALGETSSLPSDSLPAAAAINNYSPNQDHGTSSVSGVSPNSSTRNFNDEIAQLAMPYRGMMTAMECDIEKAASIYRNSASSIAEKCEAAYHWSGKLPQRLTKCGTFSRKVFLGGVPWDSTSDDLVAAFSRFGAVSVLWPQKENGSGGSGRLSSSPKGYCYIIFENESSVADLLSNCIRDVQTGGDYFKIASPKFKSKDVQVIPWVTNDSQYSKSGPHRPDAKRTVFIGALHGMITAEALATIMNDLFGNVTFAALDTDKFKYPIGSGRVAFSSHKSYMRAVTANFVDVRTTKFSKTIQIDPYLEDSMCSSCFVAPGIYFCRAFECFRYFCPGCWQLWHNSAETLYNHKPLRRTFKPVAERH